MVDRCDIRRCKTSLRPDSSHICKLALHDTSWWPMFRVEVTGSNKCFAACVQTFCTPTQIGTVYICTAEQTLTLLHIHAIYIYVKYICPMLIVYISYLYLDFLTILCIVNGFKVWRYQFAVGRHRQGTEEAK